MTKIEKHDNLNVQCALNTVNTTRLECTELKNRDGKSSEYELVLNGTENFETLVNEFEGLVSVFYRQTQRQADVDKTFDQRIYYRSAYFELNEDTIYFMLKHPQS